MKMPINSIKMLTIAAVLFLMLRSPPASHVLPKSALRLLMGTLERLFRSVYAL
jgi:hypothetical protein